MVCHGSPSSWPHMGSVGTRRSSTLLQVGVFHPPYLHTVFTVRWVSMALRSAAVHPTARGAAAHGRRQPGRVYTAADTCDSSAGGRPLPDKIPLEERSGWRYVL